MINNIAPYVSVLFNILFNIGRDLKTLLITVIKMLLLLQTYKDGLLFNQHSVDYATYMPQAGTWASDVEAQAAAEILGHPLLIWTMNTGYHGFLYNYSDSSQSKQTLHIVHSTNHFDALVVDNPSLNLQYIEQLAQRSASGNQASPIHINSNSGMRMT
jgi:hypothetical protein